MPRQLNSATRRSHHNIWGLPDTITNVVPLQTVQDLLDDWVGGSALMHVRAPMGFGKTTQVAYWLRRRPIDEFVIWVGAGLLIKGWAETVRAAVGGLVDLGLIAKDTPVDIEDLDGLYVELQRLDKIVIVVFEGADRLVPDVDMNLIEREFARFPFLRPIIITSSDMAGESFADLDRQRINRTDLAWTAEHVRAVSLEDPSLPGGMIEAERLSAVTGGRAIAILGYLDHSSEEVRRSSPDVFTTQWVIDRVAHARPDAVDLLLVLSQFLVAPRDYLPVLANVNLEASLIELQADGLLESITLPGMSKPSAFRVPGPIKGSISDIAQKTLASRVPLLHAAASEAFLREGKKNLAMFHLASAGRYDDALDLLKLPLSGEDATVGLETLRAAADAIPAAVLLRDPEALAIRLSLSRLPPTESGAALRDLALGIVNLPPTVTDSLHERARMIVAAAVISAGTGPGITGSASSPAAELAERTLNRPWDELRDLGGIPGTLWTAQAEAEMLDGHIGRGFEFADSAMRWARDDTQNIFQLYLAKAVTASLAAVEGDFERARSLFSQAKLNYGLGNWEPSTNLNTLAFARILIAETDDDSVAVLEVAHDLLEANESGSSWSAVAIMAGAHGLLLAGQPLEAMAHVRAMLRDIGSIQMPRLLRSYTAAITAAIFITLGRPAVALSAIENAPETAEHAFCLGAHRAAGALSLGDARSALRYTDDCLALGEGHATRSLIRVLLMRAAAHEILVSPVSADASFVEAVNLLTVGPSTAPFYNTPSEALEQLWARLSRSNPRLHEATSPLMNPWRLRAGLAQRGNIAVALSRQELTVLHHLRSEKTSREIGNILYISPNTVKTHVRSVYRKLGATSRSEAIGKADRLGLFGGRASTGSGPARDSTTDLPAEDTSPR